MKNAIVLLAVLLAGCGSKLPPEPPTTLMPQYQLHKVLVVEEFLQFGIGEFPQRFDQALLSSLKGCPINVRSYMVSAQPLSLEENSPAKGLNAAIAAFSPETVISIKQISGKGQDTMFGEKANRMDIQVIVKDQKTGAQIRNFLLPDMGRNLSGNFGNILGSLRWQILHSFHRDGILPCDPGPTDGNIWDFGI